jgi:hypothetical protein
MRYGVMLVHHLGGDDVAPTSAFRAFIILSLVIIRSKYYGFVFAFNGINFIPTFVKVNPL